MKAYIREELTFVNGDDIIVQVFVSNLRELLAAYSFHDLSIKA
jgi:hypothetical protein